MLTCALIAVSLNPVCSSLNAPLLSVIDPRACGAAKVPCTCGVNRQSAGDASSRPRRARCWRARRRACRRSRRSSAPPAVSGAEPVTRTALAAPALAAMSSEVRPPVSAPDAVASMAGAPTLRVCGAVSPLTRTTPGSGGRRGRSRDRSLAVGDARRGRGRERRDRARRAAAPWRRPSFAAPRRHGRRRSAGRRSRRARDFGGQRRPSRKPASPVSSARAFGRCPRR